MDKLHAGLLVLLLAAILTIAGCTLFGGKKEIKPFSFV